MTTTKVTHTPGPWAAEQGTDCTPGAPYERWSINSTSRDWKAIASIDANHNGAEPLGDDEAEANAKLIAAAPDLLEALLNLKYHVDSMHKQWEDDGKPLDTKLHGLAVCLNNRAGDQVDAAIAKATE